MPQLTVELSWSEIGRIVLWWPTIIASFHVGRLHGEKSVVSGAPSKATVEKESPCDSSGPSKAQGPSDSAPSCASDSRSEPESFAGPSGMSGEFWPPPEILMVNGGKALHLDRECFLLKNAQAAPMRWCSKCGAYAVHRRSKDE